MIGFFFLVLRFNDYLDASTIQRTSTYDLTSAFLSSLIFRSSIMYLSLCSPSAYYLYEYYLLLVSCGKHISTDSWTNAPKFATHVFTKKGVPRVFHWKILLDITFRNRHVAIKIRERDGDRCVD